MQTLSCQSVRTLRRTVRAHFKAHGRQFAWRETRDPYRILLSEVMLQQTTVQRVASKYEEFLRAFPTVASLARAPLQNVLRVWQGMGYNRRAGSLKRAAEAIVALHGGRVPSCIEDLEALPGVGKTTARAVAAFAFDIPTVFIETNIRTVFIHTFFSAQPAVKDAAILPLIERTLDRRDPRIWYYALMDYGVALKKKFPNPGRKSAHHRPQGAFEGSNRQMRGSIIKALLARAPLSAVALSRMLDAEKAKVQASLDQLCRDGLLRKAGRSYAIA